MLYILVDIGCLHCGEESYIIGVFTNRKLAKIAKEYVKEASILNKSGGQHDFEIFNVSMMNTMFLPDKYKIAELNENEVEDGFKKHGRTAYWTSVYNREKINNPYEKGEDI